MDNTSAKTSMLQAIIDAMTQHQLGGLKKKGAAGSPAMMALEVKADKPESSDPASLLDAAKGGDDDKGHDDNESPELLQKLMEMYGKGDDDKDENC